REPVPHWHACMASQRLDGLLGDAAVLDAVEHPTEHPSGVLGRLLVAELGLLWPEVARVRALVVRTHLERRPRACRRLLEDQRHVATDHPLALRAGALLCA